MISVADPLWTLVSSLRDEVDAALTEYDAAVCRTFVAPGSTAVWDVCCECQPGVEGQAWVAVQQVVPARPFPTPEGALRCAPEQYAAELAVGVLRCAATQDESGAPPSAATLTGEAAKISRDRTILHDVVLCRWAGELLPGGLTIRGWSPLGPQGGCVGGLLEITVAVDACSCLPEPDPAAGFGVTPFGQDFGL